MKNRNNQKKVNENEVPTLGAVMSDGTLLEMVYDPVKQEGKLIVSRDGNSSEKLDKFTDEKSNKIYIPYMSDEVYKGFLYLPSEVGEALSAQDLVYKIRNFFNKYTDIQYPFLQIMADYALATWVSDKFAVMGFLRLLGSYATGKSRTLAILRAICRHSLNLGGSFTAPIIYRMSDKYPSSTMFLDEGNFYDTSNKNLLVKVLNDSNGSEGVVSRINLITMEPESFSNFSPKVIANHEYYSDPGLESRMLTIQMQKSTRSDLPTRLPSNFDWEEARKIRNNLLMYRIQNYSRISDATRIANLTQFDHRFQDTASPLVWAQCNLVAPDYLIEYLNWLTEQQMMMAYSTTDYMLVDVMVDCYKEGITAPNNKMIKHLLNEKHGTTLDERLIKSKYTVMGVETHRKNDGIHYLLNQKTTGELAKRYGIELPVMDGSKNN